MIDVYDALQWFLWGFAIGYVFNPVVSLLRRAYKEFKSACDEWNRPHG